jgi:hypothetical protein
MDVQRFDRLTRRLATRITRRTALRGALVSSTAVVMTRAGGAIAAPVDKVSICHLDKDTGAYTLISVNGNALNAHLAHGDFSPYACDGGLSCEACPTTLAPIINCAQRDFTCPTGATSFDPGGPLDPTSSAQALAACEACFGAGNCIPAADCAGAGWTAGPGNAAFGYEESRCDETGNYPDPVPSVGRVFQDGSSYPWNEFGYWGLEVCP